MAEISGSNKRRRFSMEPDCEVVVEGEIFLVHSLYLMQASQVFRSMLESEMLEATDGRIVLPNKLKEEFALVLPWLSAVVPGNEILPEVDMNQIPILLRWADEYGINGLKLVCKDAICARTFSLEDSFLLAAEFHLDDVFDQRLVDITDDLSRHWKFLQQFTDNKKLMPRLWPKIFEAAGLPAPDTPLPAHPSPAQLWQLIGVAIDPDSCEQPFGTAAEVKRGMYVKTLKDVQDLKQVCMQGRTLPGAYAPPWNDDKKCLANRLCMVSAQHDSWFSVQPVNSFHEVFYVPYNALKRVRCTDLQMLPRS